MPSRGLLVEEPAIMTLKASYRASGIAEEAKRWLQYLDE